MDTRGRLRTITRRGLIKVGGGVLLSVAGLGLLPAPARALLSPASVSDAGPELDLQATDAHDAHLIGTDGWVYIPEEPEIPPYHPDPWAPPPFTGYIFGLRDVTGLTPEQVLNQKGKAQLTSPLLWIDEGAEYRLKLSNPGLVMRPDLVDAHTFHFHGFRNQTPIFDGEPMSSIAVPIGRSFTYLYRPLHPGTYIYHCHFEDTEHVHLGMTGIVFVRPTQNQGTDIVAPGKYVYNDGDGSTAYDREFAILLTEWWTEAHWAGAHVQASDWTEYRPEFFLMNGRAYPDTLAPNGEGTDPITGDLIEPAGYPRLQYQPMSSLIQANAGERILLRLANLGFQLQTLTLRGARMRVVGKDAAHLRGRDGTDLTYETNVVSLAPGESADVIITAPDVNASTTLLLHNRNYARLTNGGAAGLGGQLTEIRVYPAGTLPPQTSPNA